MRPVPLAALAVALLPGACSEPGREPVPPEPELLPGGYRVALDGDRLDPGTFSVADTLEGIRLTTGPGGLAWRPGDSIPAGRDVRVAATFRQLGAPRGYREAYGIFVGGRGIGESEPAYLYLLVRATGEFLVKRREGERTETLVDWLEHAAVQRVTVDGDTPVNTLAVEVQGEQTRFLVNGTVVFILPTEDVRPRGIVGLRVNHRLDLLVSGWNVGPAPPVESDDPVP